MSRIAAFAAAAVFGLCNWSCGSSQLPEDEAVASGEAELAVALVSSGSSWRYLDNGSDQGTAWRALDFDDSRWPSGLAELGYGDGDERTRVSFGRKSASKYIATYFRHSFTVSNPGSYSRVSLRLRRDDGAIVYLNGVEIYRTNLSGTVGYRTLAAEATDDGTTWLQTMVSPAALRAGRNVVAVEVHQSSASSSDLSFELSLSADTTDDAGAGAPDAGGGSVDADTATADAGASVADSGTVWNDAGTTATAHPAPTGLNVVAASDSRVALDWDSEPTGTRIGYRIHVFAGTAELRRIDVATSAGEATALTNGTTYSFRVGAVFADGESALSAAVTAVPIAATSCTPSCAGRQCGTDGCGGSCGTCPSGAACDSQGLCGSGGFARRPFSSDSPYNSLIPPNPRLDPEPSRASLVNRGIATLSAYSWSTRIYEVDGNAERHIPVTCTSPWGTCELQSEPGGVPIPTGAVGAIESDGHMVIWDVANQLSYDFYGYRYPSNSGPEGQTKWGGVVSTAGNGVDNPGGRLAAGGSTGADIARLAGVVRVHEVAAGVIPHALVGPTSNSCSAFRWPARKSDGWSTRTDCIPEGARMQLDPSIDLNQVTGMNAIDRMIAEALQRYGWYNLDNGGTFNGTTNWSIQLEIDPRATGPSCPALGATYCGAGMTGDFNGLRGRLPDGSSLMSHMRVLASWNGQ